MTTKKVTPQMLISTVKRLKLEAVAEDNARVPEGTKADDLNLRELAEWYLVCNGHMVVKVYHEWVPEKVWNLIAPLPDAGETKQAWQRGWNSSVAPKLADLLPDWLSVIAPQAGGLLTEVELVDAQEVSQGTSGYARASNTKTRYAAFRFEKEWHFVNALYSDLVLKFWPTSRVFTAPVVRGRTLFGDDVEHFCPLLFMLVSPELAEDEPVVGDCVAAVMPLRR